MEGLSDAIKGLLLIGKSKIGCGAKSPRMLTYWDCDQGDIILGETTLGGKARRSSH